MSILAFIGLAALAALILFVAEVAAIVAKRTALRPSIYLRALGARLYNFFWQLATLIGIFADVFGAFRRLVLWIRDTFLGFIPKEALLEALRDLRLAFREIVRSPLGFVWGLYESVLAATLPWLSVGVLIVGFVVTPVLLEVVLFLAHIETRPSTLLGATAVLLYNLAWRIGNFPAHFKNLKTLILAIVEPVVHALFGWVPKEAIAQSTESVIKEGWAVLTAPRGFVDGVETLTGQGSGFPLFLFQVVCLGVLALGIFVVSRYLISMWANEHLNPAAPRRRDQNEDEQEPREPVNPAPATRLRRIRINPDPNPYPNPDD